MSGIYRKIEQLVSVLWSIIVFFKSPLLSTFICLIPSLAFAQTVHPNIDLVLIEKAKRKMYLMSNGETYREFYISLGENPIGHKQQEGDDKTPEGRYLIDYRNENSRFHLSLHITYPSAKDIEIAKQNGVDPGGIFSYMAYLMAWKKRKLHFIIEIGPMAVSVY